MLTSPILKTVASLDRKRDRLVYQLATKYLLEFKSYGVDRALLDHYLSPPPSRLLPTDLTAVYLRIIESAQNRGMMNTVIGKAVGGMEAFRPVLCGFQPVAILARFQSAENLLDAIQNQLKPRGQFRRDPGSLWPVFARAAISGARFLSQFADVDDFCAWVRVFEEDPRKRAALPLLLSREVEGLGFALSCDFLKDLGFTAYAKPDVHVNAIVKGLGLCSEKADDYLVFKAVLRIADNCEVTAYNVDKLLWLVGSGRFHDHPQIGGGRIPTSRDVFIQRAHAALGVVD